MFCGKRGCWGLVCPLLFALTAHAASVGEKLTLKNDHILREFQFDGHVWKTTRIGRADNSASLAIQSDELLSLNLNNAVVTIDAFHAPADPAVVTDPVTREQSLTIPYALSVGDRYAGPVPTKLSIRYSLGADGYLRKTITATLPKDAAIDRLEVERFSVPAGTKASRGGRGEPVFVVSDHVPFFFGIEYPAAYARHTDGNTPTHASGPHDKVGNYSFIDLESRDVDSNGRAGLVRLFHFPGYAKPTAGGKEWQIISKTSVIGIGDAGESPELAFKDYLDTIKRPTRSFIHYNNWYDPAGKKLTVENFVSNTFIPFKEHLEKYGVTLNAMVPDDGWQNRQSIYEPSPKQFPGGLSDMIGLSRELKRQGTHLGLWIALNGYNSDIDWGIAHGFVEAKRNERFKKFKRYYSITDPKYFAVISQRITDLIQQCHVQYFKHDFNEMCDLTDNTGHLPTDRHGHEASVDAELALLKLERELNPDIYQNITNWIWFSPWWLQHGNNLWMLSDDTGEFNGVPEISTLVRAAAYRDVHLHRIFGNAETRPLVPISTLMTHGIIYTKSTYGSGGGDSLQDFNDYVMMYYTRGTQLKEWYIDPHILSDDQWQALARATRWSEENLQTLANCVKVGGDPSKAETHGYVAWRGEDGILALRNPSPAEAEISIPFDQSVWYRGAGGKPFHARVIYPYQADLPGTFTSGRPIRLKVPAYTLLTLHVTPGAAGGDVAAPALSAPPAFTIADKQIRFTLPDEDMRRADLLLISRNPPPAGAKTVELPQVKLNGDAVKPTRAAAAAGWSMICLDLRQHKGQTVTIELLTPNTEANLLLDRPVHDTAADPDPRLPMPTSQGYRRQSVQFASGQSDPQKQLSPVHPKENEPHEK